MNDFTPVIIETILRTMPEVTPLLTPAVWAVFRSAAGYSGIRNTYWAEVYDAVYDYLTGTKPVTSFRNKMLVAMSEAFTETAILGYEDVGGELPLDDDTQSWIDGRIADERGFIVDLFERLRDESEGKDPITEAFARADGYTKTLDGILAEAKMRGSENATAEFTGESGNESCGTCKSLLGKRHKLKYIIENDLIPRQGNDNFECGGWKCEHFWKNVKTDEEYRCIGNDLVSYINGVESRRWVNRMIGIEHRQGVHSWHA